MSRRPFGVEDTFAAHIPAGDWETLAAMGVRVRFPPGHVLFQQGDRGRQVYVLLAGAVKVVRSEADGSATILTVRTAGDVVGDLAALDDRDRSATVTTLGAVTARMVTAEQFRHFVDRPSVSTGFTRYTMARLRQADEQRTELALLPVRTRLARTLLRLVGDRADARGAATVRMSQHDIAQLLGASRNAVVAELTALRAAGVLDTSRRAIVLRDAAHLRRIADG
jgi:CRP/FNR family transcriptional regulator, cyclic AMP receptor protein